MENSPHIPYRFEILRKMVHLSSLWMPMAIYHLTRTSSIIVFSALLGFMAGFEMLRHSNCKIASLVKVPCHFILREKETKAGFHLTGATNMVLAALICILVFPKITTVTAMSIMLVADTAASLIGRKYGRVRAFDKSVEGCIGFVVFGVLTVFMLYYLGLYNTHTQFIAAVTAAVLAAFIELISSVIKIDDNLSVTVGAAMVIACVQTII